MFTYAIFAHEHPHDVLRLARVVLAEAPGSRVVIHYSAHSGAFPSVSDPRITCVEQPAAVRYAAYSMTDMMLRTLRQIRRETITHEWIVILSARCYPARPLAGLEEKLAGSGADAVLWHRRVQRGDHELHDRYAFAYRMVRSREFPFPLNVRAVRGLINRTQPLIRVKSMPRAALIGMRAATSIFDYVPHVFFGTQWAALSARAADRLLETLAHRPAWQELYTRAIFAEESLVPTLLLNTPDLRIINGDMHYTDWSEARSSSPKSLTIRDLPAIERSGKWFARKIDPQHDEGLRDALDAGRSRRRTYKR